MCSTRSLKYLSTPFLYIANDCLIPTIGVLLQLLSDDLFSVKCLFSEDLAMLCVVVQLWQDLAAPVEVTNEDIISIVAQPAVLLPRQTQGQTTETCRDDSSDAGKIRMDSLSLGAWTTSRAVDKSVHHFCLLPNGSQLPHVYRGIWRPYHTGLKEEVVML
jgi:hypothetical protein